MNKKIALITGSSTGLGLETASLLAKNGYKVYATMRHLEKQDALIQLTQQDGIDLEVKQLDVTNLNHINQVVTDIINTEGRIDILINNAGAGFVKTTELATDDEIMWQLNLNLMGVIRMTKAVLPYMRNQREGRIINISSVGGLVGQPFNEIYCATKFGVEGYTEAMASYVQPEFNIKFTLIEPGGIQSEFTNNVMAQLQSTGGLKDDEYKPILDSYLGGLKENYGAGSSQTSEEVVTVILNTLEMEEPSIRTRTSDWSEAFTELKTQADPTGKEQQRRVVKLLGK